MKINKYFKKFTLFCTCAVIAISTVFATPAESVYAENQTAKGQTSTDTDEKKEEWPVAPEIYSENAILIDAQTGAILYEKDAYEKCYPASTTKILTGLLVIENCKFDETVTFSKQAAESVSIYDASLGTRWGEQYTVEQALYGLLLHSANEIAYGLAEHVSGSLSAFVELMNKRAAEFGAINTHFANASGLHDENHYTTPYDMAMIAKGCYNNPNFVTIDSTSSTYSIPPTNKISETRYFRHRLRMLAGRDYYYEYCKGGKTGFTDEAGYCLVTFAEKNDMRLICVVFHSGEDERFEDSIKLFDWGFDNFNKVTTSAGSISSVFSTDSYYNSAVYDKYNLDLMMNVSTLTIPNGAQLADVYMAINDKVPSTNKNGVFTSQLCFKYKGHTVGTTDMTLSTTKDLLASSNLPYNDDSGGQKNLRKFKLVINIWVIAAVAAGAFITVTLINSAKDKKRRRRRRR